MAMNSFVMKYVLTGLAATPAVLDRLLGSLGSADLAWDVRPDPERFSLREMIAHLADWEPIFLNRCMRTRDEDNPILEDIDEGQLAVDHDYAHSDPLLSLARFREGRAKLSMMLGALPDDGWARGAIRYDLPVNISDIVLMILGHDGYHTKQTIEWLSAAGK